MRSKLLAVLLIATGLALPLFTGCETPAPPPPTPPEVVVQAPVQRDVTIFQDFTGNTDALESVEIRARVRGYLESYHFQPAGFVRKGDLLFEIEREPYEATLDRARADVAASEAYLERTKSDLERLEQAVKTNAVSQQEVTRATAERDQARAALDAARAAVDTAEINLGYTRIHSPIDGLISRQLVDPGNLVGGAESTLLARVFNIDPIYVYFEVNEQLVAGLLERQGGVEARPRSAQDLDKILPVSVRVDGVERVFDGQMDYIDPAADAETGTLQVRAVLPNEEGRLLPGFFVRIRVPGKALPGALLVPETALSTDLGGRYLMLVDGEGLAQKQYIEPGQLEEDNMRVILEGVDPGSRVITEGLQRARPGMPVTIAGS